MQWALDDSLYSEQLNTLILVDKSLSKLPDNLKTVFHILGGTALLFHGISSVVTIDIDIVNKLSERVRPYVEEFISDAANEVSLMPRGYVGRLVPFHPGEFEHIECFLVSLEDLACTKLYSFRSKDRYDLTENKLLERCNMQQLLKIIREEFDSDVSQTLRLRLASFE